MGAPRDRRNSHNLECTTCAQRDQYRIDVLGRTGSVHLGLPTGLGANMEPRDAAARSAEESGDAAQCRAALPARSRSRAPHVARLAAARLARHGHIPHHLGEGFGPHVRRFLRAIENREPAPVALTDAARSVETVLAFYQSARLGETIKLAPRSRAEP